MLDQHSFNIKPSDAAFRFVLASLIVAYALSSANYYLLLLSIFLYFTVYKKFCIVYYLFKINDRFSKNNFYLSFLPKHNPSPVLILNKDKKILFKNTSAINSINCENELLEISSQILEELIQTDGFETLSFECDEKIYQIQLKGISEEQFALAYFTDITEVVALNEEIEATQRDVIYMMGEIGETRSKETGNHVKRVAKYSELLAKLYGLSNKDAEMLKIASPMHDIGKVGIPDAILNAPRKLDLEEWKVMQTHAELGYEMLKSSNKPILQAAAIVAYQHHEKWDGSGYPQGLKENDIHIFGRITAIADVFDALGSERCYKKAWELEKILELFKEESAKHFDPKLIELFLENIERFLEIRDKYLD